MKTGLLTAALSALVAGLLMTGPAAAQSGAPVAPWDGTNPFDCTLQDAGGSSGPPDTGSDPLCVHYTNTVTVLDPSIGQFLQSEPQRLAASMQKCFYYQREDNSIAVATGLPAPLNTALATFSSSFFFDKAHGVGGSYIENFKLFGQSSDPTILPGFPAELKQFFGQGRGGFQFTQGVPLDPSCVGAPGAPPTPPGGAAFVGSQQGFTINPLKRCGDFRGRISTRVGKVYLGDSRDTATRKLGKPTQVKNNVLRWCVAFGGELDVGYASTGPARNRTPFILTTSRAFSTHGIHLGFSEQQLRLRLHHEKTFAKGGGTTVVSTKSKRYQFLIGFQKQRARWLAVTSRNMSRAAALGYLRRIG